MAAASAFSCASATPVLNALEALALAEERAGLAVAFAAAEAEAAAEDREDETEFAEFAALVATTAAESVAAREADE